jgi:hypothetical protein
MKCDLVVPKLQSDHHGTAAVEVDFRPIFIAIQNVASVGRPFLPLSDSGKLSLAF